MLPFENLGRAEDEYFADGIAEMIRSRLSALHSLDMISRDTAILYKKSGKTAKQIREEISVDYILGGTVLWDKKEGEIDRVRITPHLTRALDDTQIWSDVYDRDIEDIFAVQSDIAEQVTKQLDIILLEPEIRALEARPTENLEAYQAYLRGMDYWGDFVLEEDLRLAIQMFELAVKLDPEFALAYGYISRSHSSAYHLGYDRTEERKLRAKAVMYRLLELQPELPESHQALGAYYYYCLKDYDRALEELSIAEQGLPNNVEILNLIAYIRRRQGNVMESIRLMKRFTHEVFSLLLREKLIGLPLVQKILRWRHTGFNVHSQVRAQTKREAERVGKYMIRPLLSLKRLFFDETFEILTKKSDGYKLITRITVIGKIVSVSPARVILSANRAEAEAQGYERKDIAGRPLEAIYVPESLPRMRGPFSAMEEDRSVQLTF